MMALLLVLFSNLAAFFAPIPREVAYLDPGSGSFLLQLLLATLMGTLFVVRAFWGRIKAFFRRTPAEQDKESKPGDES